MSKWAWILCVSVGAFALAQSPQPADPAAPPPFITVSYIKVEPQRAEQLEAFFKNDVRKLQQARIDAGETTTWVQSKVLIPAGSEAPYNYITGMGWAKTPMLDPDAAHMDQIYAKAGTTRAAYLDRLRSVGATLVKREIWRMLSTAGTPIAEGDFIRMDSKRVDMANGMDYVAHERTIMQPLWADSAKRGNMKGWALMYIAQPGGVDRPVSYLTIQQFKDEAQMFSPAGAGGEAAFKAIHPDKPYIPMMNRSRDLSKTVHMQIARVQQVLRKAPPAASGGAQ